MVIKNKPHYGAGKIQTQGTAYCSGTVWGTWASLLELPTGHGSTRPRYQLGSGGGGEGGGGGGGGEGGPRDSVI